MKTIATLVAAGLASSAAAQDVLISIAPVSGSQWEVTAELLTAPSADGISSVWAEANFDLASTDGSFSNFVFNQGYLSSSFGPPTTSGDGTGLVELRALTMPGGSLFISDDNDDSNPLTVVTFDYDGTAEGLQESLDAGDIDLIGQNSIAFVDNANPLFGAVEFLQTATGEPGPRSFEIVVVPAPASAALLGLGGLAAARRRR